MADPVWTFTYSMNQTPEGNGFTRVIHAPDPVVTLVTGGAPANRRIEVDTSAGGDISFLISTVPALDDVVGMTAEALCNVSGPGDVGFESTFLTLDVQLIILEPSATLLLVGQPGITVATASNNADILWRITYGGALDQNIRVYRAGILTIGPQAPVFQTNPFQQFQFFVEGGSVGIFKS